MAPVVCERYFNELREPSVRGEKIHRGENFRNNFRSRTMNYCVKINWAKRANSRKIARYHEIFYSQKNEIYAQRQQESKTGTLV